jgi:glycosyltransferase involved in cell wall biosynthesis
LPTWQADQTRSIDCSGYSFQFEEKEIVTIPFPVAAPHRKRKGPIKKAGRKIEKATRKLLRSVINEKLYRKVSDRLKLTKKSNILPTEFEVDSLDLSGVVDTSIFNPNDGRKNWQDLITSFLVALGDKKDATLVVKLVTSDPLAVAKFIAFYRGRGIDHRCRVVVTSQYLTDQQLVELTDASTYYIQTTKAEGNCLPLMNFLAAGKPGVSPCHSAISDYFDDEIGFIADSNPEPAAWPHDPHLRTRSTWGRLVWTSMVEQIRESYNVAKQYPETYAEISERSREKLNDWASPENVQARLINALDDVYQNRVKAAQRRQQDEALKTNEVLKRAA